MNGPQIVCCVCQKPTTLWRPACDECAELKRTRDERDFCAQGATYDNRAPVTAKEKT